VIPTFNRSFIIAKTLDSLLNQTHREFEVVIIDDGSTDETEAVVQPYLARYLRYVKTAHNGTPHAWNLGVSESEQDYVFLTGDDVALEPNCLATLTRTVETVDRHNFGAVAPRLIYAAYLTKSTQEKPHREYAYLQTCTGDVAGSFNVEGQRALEVSVLHGYSLVRKEAFLEVGGFDEKTYRGNYYREETDLWLRFRLKGYKLYYEPRARIYCQKSLARGGQWSNVDGRLMIYEYHVLRNHGQFLKKFYGRKRFFMFSTFILRRLYSRLTEIHESKQ
jgi:glycosyltransferase involved in cell wall biosynthesis